MGWIKWCFPECFSGRKVNITGSTKTLEMMGGTNNGIFVGNMLQQWKMLLNYYLRKMCSVRYFPRKVGPIFLCWVLSQFSSVAQLCSLRPHGLHGLQHARLPCPSPTPGACSNSYPSWWCHPTISSSVMPFSSCLQSFPASGSFPVN